MPILGLRVHTPHTEVLRLGQMARQLRRLFMIVATAFAVVVGADLDPSLVGTWTTKSRKVITGPVKYSLCEIAGVLF